MKAKEALQLAAQHFKEENFSEALSLVEKLYQHYPDNPNVVKLRAFCLIETGDKKTARDLLDQLLDNNPNDPQLWLKRSTTHTEQQYADARWVLEAFNDIEMGLAIEQTHAGLLQARQQNLALQSQMESALQQVELDEPEPFVQIDDNEDADISEQYHYRQLTADESKLNRFHNKAQTQLAQHGFHSIGDYQDANNQVTRLYMHKAGYFYGESYALSLASVGLLERLALMMRGVAREQVVIALTSVMNNGTVLVTNNAGRRAADSEGAKQIDSLKAHASAKQVYLRHNYRVKSYLAEHIDTSISTVRTVNKLFKFKSEYDSP